MSYSYPLGFADFANILPVESFRWVLERYEETSGTARGDVLVREIADPKWRAEVTLRPMLLTVANEVQAMVEVLGGTNTFNLFDLRKCNPADDPTGAILGSHSVSVYALGSDGRSLRLTGLPSGYHLSRGDMISVGMPSGRRALHRVVQGATASGSGITPVFEVRPFLKVGEAPGQQVAIKKPWAKMLMVSYDAGDRSGRHVTSSGFTAIEAY